MAQAPVRPQKPAEGYIWRSVFGEKTSPDAPPPLLREGWAPPDVPNRRKELLAYWNAEDQRLAEEAAATAEAELAAARARGEGADEVSALARLSSSVGELEERLTAVEENTPATEQEIIAISRDLARAALAPTTIRMMLDEALARVDAAALRADNRISDLDQQQANFIGELGAVVADVRASASEIAAKCELQVQRAIAQRITAMQADVSEMRGPKGSKGDYGSGVSIAAGRPMDMNAAMTVWGRPPVRGDILIDGTSEQRYAYKWSGTEWQRGPAMMSVMLSQNTFHGSIGEINENFSTSNITKAGGGGEGSLPVIQKQLANSMLLPIIEGWDDTGVVPKPGAVTALWGTVKLTSAANADNWVQFTFSGSPGPGGGATVWTEYAELHGGQGVDLSSLEIVRANRPAGTNPDGTAYGAGNGLRLLVAATGAGLPVEVSASVFPLRAGV